MDKEEQLNFDFGDTQAVSMDSENNFDTFAETAKTEKPSGEEAVEEVPAPEIDDSDFGDTQMVPLEMGKLPVSEDFSPPKNVDYEKEKMEPIPQKLEEPTPDQEYSTKKKIPVNKNNPFKPQNMKRAILGWIITEKPSGVGISVPTRVSKFCADVAAFWSSPAKKRLMQPDKTVIVEIRRTREQCWPDCSRQEELLPLLIEQKELKSSLETEIRRTEPELKDSDTLFPEYESWCYSDSKNKNYRRCLRQIEKIEHALYKGSRFEQIRRAHVADFLYLAVPEGTVNPNELADGWGLINVKSDLSTQVVKEAETWNCPIENRLHLAQNIAASSRDSLFFSLGVNKRKDGTAYFTRIPKRRRK